MTFNKEQLAALAPYEEHFRTALRSRWARNPGREGLQIIHATLAAATGDRRGSAYNCASCILRLLHDVGTLYYADLEELAAKEAQRKAVKASATPSATRKKVTVKTDKTK